MLRIHIFLDSNVWHTCAELRMHRLESWLVHLLSVCNRAVSSLWWIFSAFATWAFAYGKTTDESWRSNGFNCCLRAHLVVVLSGVLPPLPFHVEEILWAWQAVVQYTHQWSEHFWRDVRVDVCVVEVINLTLIPENLLRELVNFPLVILSSEVVGLSSVVETLCAVLFWWSRLYWRHRLR